MSTIYTHEIFKKFQLEVMGIVACHLRKEKEDGTTTIFRVQDFEVQEEFRVEWDGKNSRIFCLCHMFESKGFLCRHAMVVFQYAAVPEIPSHYILKRWTVDAKSNYSTGQRANELKSREQRYKDLCQRAWKFLESGSLSEESYNVAICALEEATNHCLAVNNFIKNVPKPHESGTQVIRNINRKSQRNSVVTTLGMLDFLVHKTGGASKAGVDKKRKRYNTSQKEKLGSSLPPYDVCDRTQQRMEEHEYTLSGQYSIASAVSHPVQQRLEGSNLSSYGTWTMDGKEIIDSNSVPPSLPSLREYEKKYV